MLDLVFGNEVGEEEVLLLVKVVKVMGVVVLVFDSGECSSVDRKEN